MKDDYSKESEAIKVIMTTLSVLDEKIQKSVIEYVSRRLGLHQATSEESLQVTPVMGTAVEPSPQTQNQSTAQIDIRQFKEEKNPKSAIEMTVLLAFYLSQITHLNERKNTIGAQDIKKYFVMADFPLPKHADMTLANTKNAGYLEIASRGEYQLNAVGHNLVAHNMPSGEKRKYNTKKLRRQAKSNQKRKKK